jgi:hypothetical protein
MGSLTAVEIGDTLYRYSDFSGFLTSNNDKIKGLVLPADLTTIGDRAFSGCWNLTGITLPTCLTTIGDKAFSDCNDLQTVVVGGSGITIGDNGTFPHAA